MRISQRVPKFASLTFPSGVPELPDDYDEWEADYIEQHRLADASYEYL